MGTTVYPLPAGPAWPEPGALALPSKRPHPARGTPVLCKRGAPFTPPQLLTLWHVKSKLSDLVLAAPSAAV